jgi:hypothetical protein
MTDWENRIIGIFMERYPFSAAADNSPDIQAAGNAAVRALRIGADRLFPGFDTASPDDRESFLEAAESLEKRGLVSVRWARRRKGEALFAMVCPDPEALFAFAGRPSPAALAEAAREASREIALGTRNEPVRSLFDFMAGTINAEDAFRGIDADAVRDLARLAGARALPGRPVDGSLPEDAGPRPGGITPRALSVALYGNSKRLEELTGLFGRILGRAERRGILTPDFSDLGRSFPDTLAAGRLVIRFGPGEEPLVNAGGYILGLPLITILKIGEITSLRHEAPESGAKKSHAKKNAGVLMIENKETFYALAGDPQFLREFNCLLYTGGHPNGAVRALVSALAASGFDFFHAGDLDPDGILILQELAEITGKPVGPVRMDGPTFDRYAHCGRKLEPSMVSRVRLINESTRGLPGIGELIKKITEREIGIEQEIIDYRSADTFI